MSGESMLLSSIIFVGIFILWSLREAIEVLEEIRDTLKKEPKGEGEPK